MALTNRQIERYSRQIIIPDFGGIAQERLLAARIHLIAGHADADSILGYLVGAGVGQIDLYADLDRAARTRIIARMRDLNPDSTLCIGPLSGESGEADLALVLASDDATLDRARALCDQPGNFSIVLARLDVPARIAVLPRRPPCPRCASAGDLLASVGAHADNAGFIASLAALEAIKLLTRYTQTPKPTLIEFRGYESSARIIASTQGSTCACSTAMAQSSR